jgi:hypothetical protein
MLTIAGARFDASLASAARSLHLLELTLGGFAAALLLFAWLERRGRGRWAEVPAGFAKWAGGPYRSSAFLAEHMQRAPRLVLVAAFVSLAFAHLFAPLVSLALAKYPFDGIAIPLVPGLALVVLNWCCAWLLLARSPHAESAARTGAVGSLMGNVGLLGMAGAHFAAVELQRREGIAHACSSSVTFVVLVFALASIVQALVTLAALRVHREALVWSPGRDASGAAPSADRAAAPHWQSEPLPPFVQ